MAEDTEPNYLRAAFLVPAHLAGVIGGAAAAVASGEPLALFVALGVEGVYLGVLATSQRFRRAVRARSFRGGRQGSRALEALLAELSSSQREHYLALRDLREHILANYRRLPGGRVLVASSELRLDELLTSFVRLLATLNGYRQFLGAADREQLEAELRQLEAELPAEANPRVREVKEKRVEILRKRVQRFHQAEESREVVSHQLAGIEDLLRLTHEQSIAIRDPETVSRQLDALAAETSSTEETVTQLERFMAFSDEVRPLPHGTRVR